MKSFAKKLLIFIAVMAVVAGAGWAGRRAYKRSMERKLVAEAKDYVAKKDFHNASLCLQRALQLNPVSANATEAMADMLEAVGAPAAESWRMRSAKLDPNNAGKRLHWAEAAVKAQDLTSAAEALDGLDDKSKHTAAYFKLKGAAACGDRRAGEAEKDYLEAARLEPDNLAIQLNLATIRMMSTDESVAQAARVSLQQIATNPDLRLSALHQLFTDAVVRKSLPDATAYAWKIAQDSGATFDDKIRYLELMRQNKSADYAGWLAVLEKDAAASAEHAFGLGRWKMASSGPASALQWLQSLPSQTQTNQPLPVLALECQVALKNWKAVIVQADKQDWGEENFYRLALQSLAQRSIEQKAAADVSWHKAVRISEHRLDRLSRLAELSGAWGWQSEKSEVLSEVIDEFPGQNWAIDQLAGQFYAAGKTMEMEGLFSKAYSKDPANVALKNDLANLYMLRKTELDKAYVMAKEAYDSSTNNPYFASTYAYALLLQDKKDQALTVVNGLKPEYLQIPTVALYYGVVHAQSGSKEMAREALKRAEASTLLPEERAIVQLAQSRI